MPLLEIELPISDHAKKKPYHFWIDHFFIVTYKEDKMSTEKPDVPFIC